MPLLLVATIALFSMTSTGCSYINGDRYLCVALLGMSRNQLLMEKGGTHLVTRDNDNNVVWIYRDVFALPDGGQWHRTMRVTLNRSGKVIRVTASRVD